MTGVLSDLRVLDFGRFIAAPYCGMILADMGAEVIRVERPGGEQDRIYGLPGPNGENAFFLGLARNKKAITLDPLHESHGPKVLARLIATADVVLHNFSPGAAERMGLGYADACRARPDIIYTAVSCYGGDGPYSRRVGFDPLAQTLSGAIGLNGFDDGPPVRSQLPWVDYSTGLAAAVGTLLALRHRDHTGEGQQVDCALLQTAVSFMAPFIAEATVFGRQRPRLGNRAPYVTSGDLYRCRDGWVYISTITDSMWRRLCRAVGQEDLLEDPGLANDLQRFENRDQIDPKIARWTQERSVEDVLLVMEENRIPCARALSPTEVPQDPQVVARRMLEYLDVGHPGMEELPVSGIPMHLSRSAGCVESPAPRVGEHNDEIYCGVAGFGKEELAELRRLAVV